MGKSHMYTEPICEGTPKPLFKWLRAHPILFGTMVLPTLVAFFYGEEYWRGKHAWEKCKRELLAKGAVLDWASLRPPGVADDENFFKAPGMTEWFAGNTVSDLTEKMSLDGLNTSATLLNTQVLAEVTLVLPDARVTEAEADIVLQYGDSLLALSAFGGNPDSSAEVLPLIVMDQVPLADAIKNLARHAGLNYMIDPRTGLQGGDSSTLVSVRWENVTAREALNAILKNYSLQLVGGIQGSVARIKPMQQNTPRVEVSESVQARTEMLILSALEQSGNRVPVRGLSGPQQLGLVQHPLKPIKPLRVAVRTDESPTAREVAQFLSPGPFSTITRGRSCFEAKPLEPDSFQILLQPRIVCSAADYLAWSDHFQPEFDMIRTALKRPHAQMDGMVEEPADIPIQNFVTVRTVAQTLAQRAQCHLLLNHPEAALKELTLMHDLRRTLVCEPVTLVAAMINVAVAGLYVETVADGLRMKTWQEGQLAAIRAQLQEVNLVPPVAKAFEWERLYRLRGLANGQAAKLIRLSEVASIPPPEPTRLQRLRYALLALVPRGWVLQNMATIGSFQQDYLDAVDTRRGVIFARQIDAAAKRHLQILDRQRPNNFIAAAAYPMFIRAWQTLAHNQTLVNEALAACALEHYRLSRGRYPETMQALVPEFADGVSHDAVSGQALIYRPTEDGGYLLYSAAWDGIDDGGSTSHPAGGGANSAGKDWVWGDAS